MIMNSKQVLESLRNELEHRKCRFLEIGGEAAEIRADECHEHLMLIEKLRLKSGKI
jgi:hypothetical protein